MEAAVANVEKTNTIVAMTSTFKNCRLKVYQSVLNALSKISAGKKSRKTSDGSGKWKASEARRATLSFARASSGSGF